MYTKDNIASASTGNRITNPCYGHVPYKVTYIIFCNLVLSVNLSIFWLKNNYQSKHDMVINAGEVLMERTGF